MRPLTTPIWHERHLPRAADQTREPPQLLDIGEWRLVGKLEVIEPQVSRALAINAADPNGTILRSFRACRYKTFAV